MINQQQIIYLILIIFSLTIASSTIINNNKIRLGDSSSSNNPFKYVMSTLTTLELSNVCPNTNQVDYYAVGQCVDGYMYECNLENKSVIITTYEDFNCQILGKSQSVEYGCTEMYNSTYFYTCVEDITPMPNSYVVSSYNNHGCDQSSLFHQKYFKLDNCNSLAQPILYGSCNSTYFSYTFYNDTACHNSQYSQYDPLNTCTNSEVFSQSYLSQCIF